MSTYQLEEAKKELELAQKKYNYLQAFENFITYIKELTYPEIVISPLYNEMLQGKKVATVDHFERICYIENKSFEFKKYIILMFIEVKKRLRKISKVPDLVEWLRKTEIHVNSLLVEFLRHRRIYKDF